ncbi:MAG: CDP-alcohol phosphatidyltransferase family protein [Bacteroidales bacterium]|nr:CDP-alcohol phosphatidyltransferase family protein [Bacteroidales bacterium]
MSKFSEIKQQYKSSLKSMDTEETLDLMFYRPIGYMWALLCAKVGITPNAITIASIFLGVAGGIMFYFGKPHDLWLNYVGMFLLVWANSFDSADGQLARMTKQYSRLGRILDGLSGDFWFVAIYFAICFRVNETSDFFMQHWSGWIWVMAILAGGCHAKQAAMADYYRQFHLYFLKGKEGSELDSVEQLDKDYAQVSWKGHFWKKITMMFYRNYTANQEVMTPSMQKLRRKLKALFGDDNVPEKFRNDFRLKSKPLMKYTNMLSFNTRVIALFVSIIVRMPWLYFAFELTVLNLMLVYMILRHERICRKFIKKLDNGAY